MPASYHPRRIACARVQACGWARSGGITRLSIVPNFLGTCREFHATVGIKKAPAMGTQILNRVDCQEKLPHLCPCAGYGKPSAALRENSSKPHRGNPAHSASRWYFSTHTLAVFRVHPRDAVAASPPHRRICMSGAMNHWTPIGIEKSHHTKRTPSRQATRHRQLFPRAPPLPQRGTRVSCTCDPACRPCLFAPQ
jgi:hypothetical protein